ncbi:MAG: hypothetical protein QM608_21275, partial [Caulobacter sp.]
MTALFGAAAHHSAARERLRRAYKAARAEKSKATLEAYHDPGARRWLPKGDEVAIDRASPEADKEAAADAQRWQIATQVSEL